MLKYKADLKILLFLIIATSLLLIQWNYGFNIFIYVLTLYFSITVAIIAHNHNHLPIWKSGILNHITDYWISLLYGFPTFAWIPTHNRNHHKFNNKEGDYTITYRVSEENNILTLLSYPGISSYYQQSPIMAYLRLLWSTNKTQFVLAIGQYFALGLLLGISLYMNWQKSLLYIIIPHQVSLFSVLVFNYIQHVHADEESEFNHSRNFVSRFSGFMLFNNGLHTVHHLKANTHWSELRAAHDKVKHLIDPKLNQTTVIGYLLKAYIVAPFKSAYRTNSMRLERINKVSQQVEN
jgi:fatty acid desaturase